MAITHNEVQVTWDTTDVNQATVATSGNETSDTISFDTTAIGATLALKASNDGAPTTGDTVDFYIRYSSGDPDGAGSDEFDTVGHAQLLTTLDTNGENPAIRHIPINSNAKSFQVYAVNNSSTNAITVSATMTEVRG